MYKYLVKEDDDKLIIVGEGTKTTIDKKKDGLVSVKTEEITENEYLLLKKEELEKRVAELEMKQEQPKEIKIMIGDDLKSVHKVDLNLFLRRWTPCSCGQM